MESIVNVPYFLMPIYTLDAHHPMNAQLAITHRIHPIHPIYSANRYRTHPIHIHVLCQPLPLNNSHRPAAPRPHPPPPSTLWPPWRRWAPTTIWLPSHASPTPSSSTNGTALRPRHGVCGYWPIRLCLDLRCLLGVWVFVCPRCLPLSAVNIALQSFSHVYWPNNALTIVGPYVEANHIKAIMR